MSAAKMDDTSILQDDFTPEQVAAWLHDKGIPEEYTKVFIENFIDGQELLALSEEDIAKMVKPVGLVKKIARFIKKASPNQDPTSPPPSANEPTVPQAPPPPAFEEAGCSHTDFCVPDHWSEGTMECITKQVVTPAARKEIVQTLATMLRARQQRPTSDMCREAAEQLVLKYPFMKDPFGQRSISWQKKITEHLENKRKYLTKKTRDPSVALPPAKRPRTVQTASRIHRYPVLQVQHNDDEDATKRHLQECKKEMQRVNPRDDVLLELMRSTFQHRRDRIATGITQSVREILELFPALKRPAVVEQDMELVMQQTGIVQKAAKSWREIWIPAVLELGNNSKKPSMQVLLKDYKSDETDSDKGVLHAVKVLLTLYLPKGKKLEDTLIHLYEEYEMSSTMEEAAVKEPKRTSPRIAAFNRDNAKQYFIFIEQDVFCEVPNLSAALILWFCVHYVFDLEYSKPVKEIGFFFQDVVFSYPDQVKRPATYLAVTGDIKRFSMSTST